MKNVYYQNKETLENIIKNLKYQGKDKLHIVSDFDRTLTKLYKNGKKIYSSVALIREGGYLGKDIAKKEFELFDKYHPIEINLDLPYEYRYKKMEEWWKKHLDLFIEAKLNKSIFKKIVNDYKDIFREGVSEFFKYLKNENIPILIFSSGIGDLIELFLKENNLLSENVYIVSNYLRYDKNGYVIGYDNNIIHVLNKSETHISNKKYLDAIKNRNNVILLGDSLGDIGMINNLEINNVIKIGFLNEKIDESLKLYLEKYDIVLTNDASFDYVNNLLYKILN